MKTLRQTIISDDDIAQACQSLNESVLNIQSARLTLAELNHDLRTFNGTEEHEDILKEIEGEYLFEVTNEVTPEVKDADGNMIDLGLGNRTLKRVPGGKKVFTNETQRKAEVTRRCANDERYQKAKQAIRDAEIRKSELRMKIENGAAMAGVFQHSYEATLALLRLAGDLARESTVMPDLAKLEEIREFVNRFQEADNGKEKE